MITDNVEKVLVNTQDELKNLRHELELLQNPLNYNSPDDYKYMFNKIKNQLSSFEEKMGTNIDYLIANEMVNHDDTLNKLPLIARPEQYNKELPIKMSQSLSGYRNEIQKTIDGKMDSRFMFTQKMMSNPTSSATKKMLKDKYALPFVGEPHIKMKPYSTLKPLPAQKHMSFGKTAKPLGLAPKEQRDNPFASASLRDKDIKEGIFNLIGKGVVPKEADLTPAFEKGAPTLSSQKMKMHSHKDQFIKGEISTVPSHIYTTKFDVKALEQTGKQEAPKPVHSFLRKADSRPLALTKYSSAVTDTNTTRKDFNMTMDKVNAKDYEEVMDVYSLHQFIIRKGKTLIETPEFQSYQRTFANIWGYIDMAIQMLEKVLTEHDIRVAYIDGKKLAGLAEGTGGRPSLPDLLDCIVNQDDIRKVIKIPQNLYKGANGSILAAIRIQSYWRMFKARKTYRRVKVLISKVQTIQKAARLFLNYKKTLQIIKDKKEEYYNMYKELAQKFQEDWPQNKYRKRVEIHIQSISVDEMQRLSMEKFLQKQNAQIARLFALKDPLVDIIYISPFDLPPEVLSYYSKVLELGGLEQYQNRFHILWPEKHHAFPGHFPTARVLLYSPKTLKRIKQLIHGKVAYIVPSIPSSDDIDLSVMLNVPLFAGDPQKNALYSTKSGAKSIFNACEMPIPPGSFNIYDEKEFILTLTKLIAYNFHINQWIFKIDDEFNGRGHAAFYIDQVKPLVQLRNLRLPVNEDLILKVHDIVASLLPTKIKITMPHLYRNYNEYITKFVQKGGVIEAAPNCSPSQIMSSSVGFIIDPVGDVQLMGSYDKFFAKDYVACGYFFPQKSIPNLNLQAVCETVGKALYSQGVFGYASLDIISFPDPSAKKTGKKDEGENRIFWAVDLNCYMTSYMASTLLFDFLMKGNLDTVSGLYTIPSSQTEEAPKTPAIGEDGEEEDANAEKRCYMYCPFFYHAGLSAIQYKTFFHLCRMKGISYDLESKTGTTFILLDSLQTGTMGLIAIGKYKRNVVKYMNDSLNFILTQTGQMESKVTDYSQDLRPDTMYLNDVAGRVRLIHRGFEKKQKKTPIK